MAHLLRDEGGLIAPMFNDWVEGRRAEVGGWVSDPTGTMMGGTAMSKCWLNA
jgi:peptide/nickel transport system substrate-binding protein